MINQTHLEKMLKHDNTIYIPDLVDIIRQMTAWMANTQHCSYDKKYNQKDAVVHSPCLLMDGEKSWIFYGLSIACTMENADAEARKRGNPSTEFHCPQWVSFAADAADGGSEYARYWCQLFISMSSIQWRTGQDIDHSAGQQCVNM